MRKNPRFCISVCESGGLCLARCAIAGLTLCAIAGLTLCVIASLTLCVIAGLTRNPPDSRSTVSK